MSEIDPVILELRADLNRYTATLRSTTTTVDKLLGQQERRAQRLEAEMRRSTDGIAASLRGLAGVLAGAFTGRELVGFIDSFTRLQNELRVAGLEGEALAGVQSQLFEVANRNGVAINALADLYGKAAQAGGELGASQQQLLALTENTALALRISGTDATTASGAILGLSQALAGGTVRAEEFNQINEGGLRPLLQAAAASERFGGSVAKLRAAVLDGTVSSQEFFRSILAGSSDLETKAANAALTLSGAFQTLNNKLVEYVGGGASASGATGLLAQAIEALANNLDDVVEALSVIAVVMGGRFVAGAVAGGRALQTVSAYATIATTSLAGTALAARGAGAALLAAFGGPVGAAITAVTLAIGYLIVKSNEATKATGAYATAQAEAERVTEGAAKVAGDLAVAHGRVRVEALAAARAERENTKQKLASARASVVLARAELAKARAFAAAQNQASFGAGGVPGTGGFIQGQGDKAVAQARGNLAAANATAKKYDAALKTIEGAIEAAAAPTVDPVAVGDKDKTKPTRAGRGPSGPSADELAARQASEINRLQQEELRARAQLTDDANERAEIERDILRLDYQQRKAEIENDGDLSRQQKDAQLEILQNLYGVRDATAEGGELVVTANRSLYALAIERQRQAQVEREQADLADERYQAEADQLRLQYDLADTQDQRRAIALQILEAEDRYLRSKLEAIIASEAATDAERERARIALASLQATAADRREAVSRSEAGALDRYARGAKDADARVEEAAARRIRDLNETIADAMTNALGVKDPFLKDLISIFLDQNVFGPLAEALGKAGSGGGGIFSAIGTALGSIFKGGKASGGYVSGGSLYRVNEGASPGRVEGFMPTGSGQIIPLGRMDALRASGGASGPIRIEVQVVEGQMFEARVLGIADGRAVQVVQASAKPMIDAAANETMRRFTRPRT